MKRYSTMLVMSMLIVAGMAVTYLMGLKHYPTRDHHSELRAAIATRLHAEHAEIDLKLVEQTGHKLHVLYRAWNYVGLAEFEEGWNGRYKLHSASTGTSWIDIRKVDTNNVSYLFLSGRNTLGIHQAVASVNDDHPELEFPESEYFIVKVQIQEEALKQPSYVHFLDKSGEVIRTIKLTL
ncbi:hypothetical protein [Paenibacillus sp. YYML68]|uniref:hypothetical protein n=1 Tax=Paenibacillus sp. YYML68 TaxID=2909250 RepID=UPI0024902099|nr:hypothetical protein [Paenibacillus sp. YYML68]